MKMPITIIKKRRTFSVEFDLDRWEKIASALGLHSDEFLESLDRAEEDIKEGRIYKLSSLDDA